MKLCFYITVVVELFWFFSLPSCRIQLWNQNELCKWTKLIIAKWNCVFTFDLCVFFFRLVFLFCMFVYFCGCFVLFFVDVAGVFCLFCFALFLFVCCFFRFCVGAFVYVVVFFYYYLWWKGRAICLLSLLS